MPFYAGFGNKETDAVSYEECGIPSSKIFIVDPMGHVVTHQNSRYYKKSYKMLADTADFIFRPQSNVVGNQLETPDDFNNFNYWREQRSHSSLDLDDL